MPLPTTTLPITPSATPYSPPGPSPYRRPGPTPYSPPRPTPAPTQGPTAAGDLVQVSLVGTRFVARWAGNVLPRSSSTSAASGLVTEVFGSAYRTGEHTFVLDPADPLPEGFVLR